MAEIEIRLPKMGESVTEATITNWLKNPGENVSLDEPLVEVATDKVDNELPSEAEGILIKQLFEKDQVAQVGDVIAIISTDGDAAVSEDNNKTQSQVIVEENPTLENNTSEPKIEINTTSNGNESIKISKNGSNGQYKTMQNASKDSKTFRTLQNIQNILKLRKT